MVALSVVTRVLITAAFCLIFIKTATGCDPRRPGKIWIKFDLQNDTPFIIALGGHGELWVIVKQHVKGECRVPLWQTYIYIVYKITNFSIINTYYDYTWNHTTIVTDYRATKASTASASASTSTSASMWGYLINRHLWRIALCSPKSCYPLVRKPRAIIVWEDLWQHCRRYLLNFDTMLTIRCDVLHQCWI